MGGTGGAPKPPAAGAGASRDAQPIRWLASSPPGFEGFGIEANWAPGPSIGLDTECVVHEARDPGALMPALLWTPIAGGTERCDPRAGLRYGEQPIIGVDEVSGVRTAVLRATLGEVDDAYAHHLRTTTSLGTGRALGLLHSWQPFSTQLPRTCGFGVARPSARAFDVFFGPRGGGAPKLAYGQLGWGSAKITWTPFFDPKLEPKESAVLGPEPRVLLSVTGAGGAIGPVDPRLPATLLSAPIAGQSQQGHSLVAYGNRGIWVEDLGDRDRIRSYTQADGVKTELSFEDGRVRSVVFDGERTSGAMQARFADPHDASNQLRVWTQDPVTKAVSFSPAYVAKRRSGPAPLKSAGRWAVLGAFSGERPPKPDFPSQYAPLLADGSLEVILAVNLITWQAYRIAIPPGSAFVSDGLGVDDTFIYVSLRPNDPHLSGVRELRRYPLARIAEWGTPWTPE